MKLAIALLGAVIILSSCKKYQEIASANFPDQLIYMPAATNGNYEINSISQPTGNTPTQGEPFRFTIDLTNKKFIVPLSVYRSGINNKGGFNVNIAINTDTITNLITIGNLTDTDILHSGKYSIPSSINMSDGQESVPFDLSIDLDYLRNNFGKEFVALGVGISSTERKSNPKLSTTIVIIDTKILKPTAEFTFNVEAKKIDFTNTSQFSKNCLWDFGDGTPTSTDIAPSHTFSNAGTYTVTLTAIGITGDEDKSMKTVIITIL